VIPGHGQPFTDVGAALERSLQRLAGFERDESRMMRHVLPVMFVFPLMDRRRLPVEELDDYLDSVPLYADFNRQYLTLDDSTCGSDRRQSGTQRCGGKKERLPGPGVRCLRTSSGNGAASYNEVLRLGETFCITAQQFCRNRLTHQTRSWLNLHLQQWRGALQPLRPDSGPSSQKAQDAHRSIQSAILIQLYRPDPRSPLVALIQRKSRARP
jgi:hypothetical protein